MVPILVKGSWIVEVLIEVGSHSAVFFLAISALSFMRALFLHLEDTLGL